METMSRRVEESESLANNLKEMIQKLDLANTKLKEKNEKLENIVLYHMIQNGEIKSGATIEELKAEEEKEGFGKVKGLQEIEEMKYDRGVLLNMVFHLKQENLRINQTLQQITIEANTRIRNLTEKNKK